MGSPFHTAGSTYLSLLLYMQMAEGSLSVMLLETYLGACLPGGCPLLLQLLLLRRRERRFGGQGGRTPRQLQCAVSQRTGFYALSAFAQLVLASKQLLQAGSNT